MNPQDINASMNYFCVKFLPSEKQRVVKVVKVMITGKKIGAMKRLKYKV